MTAFGEPTSAPSQPQARGGETVLHDRRITVDGVETQYLEAGAGPLLLLLHGHEQGATSWRWVIPALARTHRVLALSLPHGRLSVFPIAGTCPTSNTPTASPPCSAAGSPHPATTRVAPRPPPRRRRRPRRTNNDDIPVGFHNLVTSL